MKRTDLEKNKGLKINARMQAEGISSRFGKESPTLDRREQRKIDQAAGLVPFAVKLNGELIKRIQDMALEQQISVNDLTAQLLQKGLDS